MSSLLQNRGSFCIQFRLDGKAVRFIGFYVRPTNHRSPQSRIVFVASDRRCCAQIANPFPTCDEVYTY
jgi:hypothetical protein